MMGFTDILRLEQDPDIQSSELMLAPYNTPDYSALKQSRLLVSMAACSLLHSFQTLFSQHSLHDHQFPFRIASRSSWLKVVTPLLRMGTHCHQHCINMYTCNKMVTCSQLDGQDYHVA